MNEELKQQALQRCVELGKDYKGEIFMVKQESLDEYKKSNLDQLDDYVEAICKTNDFPMILNPACIHRQR